MIDLKVAIGKLKLKNPVMTASGTAGYGEELAEFFDPSLLGALVMKGISLEPWQGNPPPRIAETPCGMINSIGLQNVGLKAFLREKLPFARQWGKNVPVIANIIGMDAGEYVRLAAELDGAGVEGIELNVSCPNIKKGGISFGRDMAVFAHLVGAVRKEVHGAVLIVKLTPESPAAEFARAAEENGADAVSLINSIPALAIDIETRRPFVKNVIGGLSGPAIKPIAVRMVYQAGRAVKIPIIGMGGITEPADAIEFMLAGAHAVAVGTAVFRDPLTPLKIIEGIKTYMEKKGVERVSGLTGAVKAE